MFSYSPQLAVASSSDTRSPEERILEELQRLAVALQQAEHMQLRELNTAPLKPRTGMVVLADGTNWDPGSGAGFYGYYGGSWVKLG